MLQSTYCDHLRQHCETIGRTVHIVNLGGARSKGYKLPSSWLKFTTLGLQDLYSRQVVHADPAAEEFQYPVSFDIRDLVTLEDVIEECALGPNG